MRLFVWADGGRRGDGGRLIAEAVGLVAGVDGADVVLSVRCPRCGGRDHGKPDVVAPRAPDGGPFQASLSRARGAGGDADPHTTTGSGDAAGLTVVAVAAGAPLGVDIERAADVARAPIDGVALHPLEREALEGLDEAARNGRLAAIWTAKEAVLKATGHGLTVDPGLLALGFGTDGAVTLLEWPDALALGEPPSITTFRLAGGDVVGALAVLSPRQPELRITCL